MRSARFQDLIQPCLLLDKPSGRRTLSNGQGFGDKSGIRTFLSWWFCFLYFRRELRHMTPGQRKMVAAMIYPEGHTGGDRKSKNQTPVPTFDFPMVSKTSLTSARKVLRLANDLVGNVIAGHGNLTRGGNGAGATKMVAKTALEIAVSAPFFPALEIRSADFQELPVVFSISAVSWPARRSARNRISQAARRLDDSERPVLHALPRPGGSQCTPRLHRSV
jgi:hypothetical protein